MNRFKETRRYGEEGGKREKEKRGGRERRRRDEWDEGLGERRNEGGIKSHSILICCLCVCGHH